MKKDKKVGRQLWRLCIYFAGMWIVSAGIVMCVKCGLGISPVSSVPYVLSFATPFTFGTLTMLFHLANILLQYILERRWINIKVFLQIPVAFLFGWIIDFLKTLLSFEAPNMTFQILFLLISIFLTALGMVFMINMKLVQNPPDGTVRLISSLLGKEMGNIKIIYDILMTMISIVLSILLLGEIKGFGIATILSAIFVGKTLSLLQRSIGKLLIKKLY